MVNKGTVASKMAATAESMTCSPQEMRKNGMAIFVMPNSSSGPHSLRLPGKEIRWIRMTTSPNKRPKRTRNATSVIGPTSCTASLIHMKEELQMAPSNRKTNQCFGFKGDSYFINDGMLVKNFRRKQQSFAVIVFLLLRDHCAFQPQQPFFCLESLAAAIAVQFAIFTDHAVTGNYDWHGIGGVGAAYGARGAWSSDFDCDVVIAACFPVWNSEDCL